MRSSKFAAEQMAMAIRQHEAGTAVGEIYRKLEISDTTRNLFVPTHGCIVSLRGCRTVGVATWMGRCFIQAEFYPSPQSSTQFIAANVTWTPILPVGQSGLVEYCARAISRASFRNQLPFPQKAYGSSDSDFGSTSVLSGISAFDANGTDITSDTEFVFASGVDIPRGMPAVVPEPSTWALVGTGLVGVAVLARRRRVA